MKRYDGKGSYQIGLHKLSDHLGMVGLEYTSKIKERLAPAHKELSERGFLEKVLYLPMRTEPGEEKVVYSFGTKLLPPGKKRKTPKAIKSRPMDVTVDRDGEVLAAACDAVFESLPEETRQDMEQTIMAGWMPEMIERLQDPNSLAAREHRRLLRHLVEREYPKEVQASLKKS